MSLTNTSQTNVLQTHQDKKIPEAHIFCPGQVQEGVISIILGTQQVSLQVQYCKRHEIYFTTLTVTKQWISKWPYITNANCTKLW